MDTAIMLHKMEDHTRIKMAANIVDDEYQSLLANGWMPSYNQRALLCKILYNHKQTSIRKVKLVTKEKGEETYNCSQDIVISKIDDFYAILDDNLMTFDNSTIENDDWNAIVDFIELSQFKYENIYGAKHWTTVTPDLTNEECAEKFNKLTLDSQIYISAFTAALKCDMKDGQAKYWMIQLVNTLVMCLKTSHGLSEDEVKLNVWAPFGQCNTNAAIETVFGDKENLIMFNSSSSEECSSELSLDSSSISHQSCASSDCGEKYKSRQTVAPDVCVALRHFPGIFPLIVALKPAGSEAEGFQHNMKQMLSKLFYQDVVFGIVVSSRHFQLSAIFKEQGNLQFLNLTPISLCKYRNNAFHLDLQALQHMCSFIYRILKWSLQSKCLVKT